MGAAAHGGLLAEVKNLQGKRGGDDSAAHWGDVMKLEGVPVGYEAVRFGLAKQGELFLASNGDIAIASFDHDGDPRLIIREQPPAVGWMHGVFNDGWIAQDSDRGSNRVWWFEKKPRQEEGRWEPVGDTKCAEVDFDLIRKECVRFRDDIPWTDRITEVGPLVEK